ncbi:MAG: hypothetical protein ACREBU_26760, partial [Nitrososphaera sp.]
MQLTPLVDRCNSWIRQANRYHNQSVVNPIAAVRFEEPICVGQTPRIAARLLDFEISSMLQPVFDPNAREVVGYEASLWVTRSNRELASSGLFESVTTLRELIHLDRLCHALHALNFVAQGARGFLFCNVHPRLLTGVAEAHSRA